MFYRECHVPYEGEETCQWWTRRSVGWFVGRMLALPQLEWPAGISQEDQAPGGIWLLAMWLSLLSYPPPVNMSNFPGSHTGSR